MPNLHSTLMASRRLRLRAILALAAYLPATTLAVCLHDHAVPLTDGPAASAQDVSQSEHPEPAEPDTPRSPLSHDDCVVCQFLGTKFLAGDGPVAASLNVLCCEVVPASAAPLETLPPGLPPARAPPQAG